VPPLVDPPVVDPPAGVVPPDVLPLVAPLPVVPPPVVPPRLIVPDTLAASELVPLLDAQAASETLIAARRQNFRALDSIANLITYSSKHTKTKTQCRLKSLGCGRHDVSTAHMA
jgi:hypothetical protein